MQRITRRRVREPASPLSGLIDVSHDIEPQPRTMEFEPQSMSAFRDFEDFTLNEMNRLDKYGLAEMWGRASEISMRLSMIIAKSCDSDLIKKEHADWSIAFVRYFTTEMVSLSGINITENSFDAAVQDVMSRVKEAGASGMTRKQMRESSRKFKSLTYSGQNDVVRLLLEDGEFLAVERRKVRGPASTAFIHCDHF